ncbi:MAG: alpha/beta hydrolase [Candidatus Uhrbacteria bacterium]
MSVNVNCLIIHGCPSSEKDLRDPYDKHWIPWTKKQLETRGIKTETPMMPNPWAPDYQTFKTELEKYLVSEKTILIGHSCGGAFLVRWLGETKRKIRQLILVAPWKIPEPNDEGRKKFYEFPVDETIKERVGEIVVFTSDDEEPDGKLSLKIFHDALGGKIVDLPNRGHYCFNDMKTEEFPELIETVNSNIL